MTGLVTWCTERARMVLAFVVISVAAGLVSYMGLPKEGSPNIDVPVLYVSVALPGVSAEDSERLMVKPLETELRGLDDLKQLTGIATQGHAGILLEFEFEWDKQATLADVRDRVKQAQADFPDDAKEPTINEINLSEFPVLVVSLSGAVPERTLLRLAKDLQRAVEVDARVLEAKLTGHREEMLEVLIDPLKMESYNVTAPELLSVIQRNNQLVAAGDIESASGAFSVTVPGSFENARDVFELPVKVNGDRVVRLGDVTEIRRTFEDAQGAARYNGEPSISLQISKRTGENIIETVAAARAIVAEEVAKWPAPLKQAVRIDISMDESTRVRDMVGQLEGSVATAVILVMMVVFAALGFRSAILVGIAIPCSFLLSFALMAALGMPINNMVMFGLILAVGMLVDGAIVVVEYADKEIAKGTGPMRAYAAAAKRMFWPIVASTATTLCAFLPMLFWPGMPGEFMGQLPVTLIFVLSASLVVALIFLPVLGGVSGRITRLLEPVRALLGRIAGPVRNLAGLVLSWGLVAGGIGVAVLARRTDDVATIAVLIGLGGLMILLGYRRLRRGQTAPAGRVLGYRRTPFGRLVALISTNPVGPFAALGVAAVVMFGVFSYFAEHSKGVEFFVDTEPERAIIYVRARGNISLNESDAMVRAVERRVRAIDGIESVFAFSGSGGLVNRSGNEGPPDAIGQVQIELAPWDQRREGRLIVAEIEEALAGIPGIYAELKKQSNGPQQGKPIQIELRSPSWDDLHEAAGIARAKLAATAHVINIDDTRPLPGIDWEVNVDRVTAGRYGADVATVGPLVQLVTRGATLGTYRPDDTDEELEIRMRFPADQRLLSTLDQLKVPTALGQVPLSHFLTRMAVPQLDQVQRRGGERFFLVRADVSPDAPDAVSDVSIIDDLETWIAEDKPFPASVKAHFGGDREEQQESMAFLANAFMGALGLMFVILLAQFNSLYNSLLVLSAVVMSVAGVLIGMLVMDQKFSIIMTGTGIVALAGIVVNNNIVLIDTYQELAAKMSRLEAIVRTAEQRIRPVLLTTITTMAGLMPMVFATSIDFAQLGPAFGGLLAGGLFSSAGWGVFLSLVLDTGAPTALWWVQLATAVVFGLGISTLLTLLVTPAALAARIWVGRLFAGLKSGALSAALGGERRERARLARAFRRHENVDLVFPDETPRKPRIIQAAE